MTLVLDASVALDWCFESEQTAYAETVLDHVVAGGAVVSPIWPVEVANGLLSAKRRKRVTSAEMGRALAMLCELNIKTVEPEWTTVAHTLLATGDRFGLTAYLLLALQEGRPLATHDAALRTAADQADVALFGLEPSVALA